MATLIACFHGGGSTGDIFKIQCERLQAELEGEGIELVFFDGPFERDAGPGMQVFEDYGPFKSWFFTDALGNQTADGSGFDESNTGGLQRVRRMLELRAPKDQWAGVMGFSQGTRVAAGLLLEQQQRINKGTNDGWNFGFGIFCNGGGAPMQSSPAEEPELIKIPTLHVHGSKDFNLENGRKQKKGHFDEDAATLMEINYHHAMPWTPKDLDQFAGLIKQLYHEAQK
ncbi:MAG: hypothetical protein M1820_001193 [Bogoriella megaspora]|nr:MAG: hypothetical protein M1820_001193 [Bogoriella megaspora]